MKSFLEHVAADLLSRYGTNLSRVAVVFPNKRASLFLNEHLARLAGQPLWSPAYITISDLFRSHSDLKVADPILLVCELHKCFTACTTRRSTTSTAGDSCCSPTSTTLTRIWDLPIRCSPICATSTNSTMCHISPTNSGR